MTRPDYTYFIARRKELAAKAKRMAGKKGVNEVLGQLKEVVLTLRQIEIKEAE